MSKIFLDVRRKPILIDGYETRYVILSCGWVYNTETQRYMKGGKDSDGYHIISLSLNGKKHTRKIHRLVAEAFIPNPENLPEVDHIDTDKWNNEMSNLEWVTTSENIHRASMNNLRPGVLDETMATAICILLQDGSIRISDIAKITGVRVSSINKIKAGYNWRSVSCKYDFSNYKFGRGISGENCCLSKITRNQAIQIKDLLKKGISPTEVSKIIGVSRPIVYHIKYGKAWTNIT